MRIGTALAAALLVAGTATETAAAATVTPQTGTLTYTCTFPGMPPQPTTLTAELDVTDPHPGQPFTVIPSATQVIPSTVRAFLRSAGYDAVRGSLAGTFGVSNATPDIGTISGSFLDMPIGTTGPITITVAGPVQTFTAGAAGTIGFSMGPGLSEPLEFHRASTGTWVTWSTSCTLKVTSPAQNRAFQPDMVIS
ncbi:MULTISPECIES: DUF6801 domain-containing protein [Amycolatopsis]|uniref:DUF6801 domain-containing protein n=1 Tax=Amycolatopsis bullii TaxID=941987 RepID=A0ABQ3KH90_9PSEU|nr:DUF6801 domain-containing protein [Amycolatopsis bullii]GHG24908.1 hypothetical protein GCM10017567_50110 [Amycolatopsis bullii]